MPLTSEFADLGPEFSQPIKLSPLESPKLVHWNSSAAQLIGLETLPENILTLLNGIDPLPTQTVASLYAGHQFGVWVPQLGDGRAAVLGQINHANYGPWEIQTKGGGVTPFSRMGDGRAVLRSSIREYLCSEAMHALGIPSTRALALIDSETKVYREEVETGALIARMAPTHIRFGSFEVFASRQQTEQVQQLADFVIDSFYPECRRDEKPYLSFFQAVIARTAKMIAHWQAQGFAHGVMNTDNMSILGLTIDYGPFGFLESYNPGFICNHSDYEGRYAFDQQPNISLWNLSRLGNSLLPLLDVKDAQEALESYAERYYQNYYPLMFAKLGITKFELQGDRPLLSDLLGLLNDTRADYSRCFRLLSREETQGQFAAELGNTKACAQWLSGYQERIADVDASPTALAHNPKYILRNYMAQIAIDKAKEGDYSEIDRLMRILQAPFDEHPEAEEYFAAPPKWAHSLSVSCSS